jgi:hypothetical protein
VAKRLGTKAEKAVAVTPVPGTVKTVAMTVTISPPESSNGVYVNYIEIAQTPFDFTLLGAQLPGKLKQDQVQTAASGQTVAFDADFQVTFPATIMVSFIRALIDQKELYERTYGVKLGEISTVEKAS